MTGIGKVPNFWLNTFDSIHENMTNCFNRAIANSETNPQWLTQGITNLLRKFNETNIPKSFRLITCLSTMYKILTSKLQKELTISCTHITSYHLNKKDVEKDPMAAKTSC